jgi:predicted nucleic acid-binding protein
MNVANSFYMDANALAKRYIPEAGNELVDVILDTVPSSRIYFLNVGTGEVYSILVRKRNTGSLSPADFRQATADFHDEIVDRAAVTRVPVTNRLVTSSLQLILTHSINSTDALILKSALTIALRLRRAGDDLVLVASDQRLLRAAQAEGLVTFNPDTQNQAALAALAGP